MVWFVKMVESLFVAPVMVEAGPEEVLEPVVRGTESFMTALDWLVVARDLSSTMALRSSRCGSTYLLANNHSNSAERANNSHPPIHLTGSSGLSSVAANNLSASIAIVTAGPLRV